MSRRHRLMVVLASLLVSVSALAQQLRTCDVIVRDHRGTPVHGLTATDLILLEDGKPKEISAITELSGEAAPARRFLFIFDRSTIGMSAQKRTVEAIREFITANVTPRDRVKIASITPHRSIDSDTPWSSDPAVIEAALKAIGTEVVASSAAQERKRVEQQIRGYLQADAQMGGRSIMTFDVLMGAARQYASLAREETIQTLEALHAALGLLGGAREKKIVVLAGGGLPLRPAADVFTYLETIRNQIETGQVRSGGMRRGTRGANPMAELARYDVTEAVRRVADDAYERGIAIYTLDPDASGSTDSNVERILGTDMNADFVGVATRMAGYQLISNVSGGMPLLGRRPNEALQQVSKDLAGYYTVSFNSVPWSSETPMPRIEVKGKNGYRVRATMGSMARPKELDVQELVVAHHVQMPSNNELSIALMNDPPVDVNGRKLVKVKVLIPVGLLRLVPDGGQVHGGFNVYVSTGDPTGKSSKVNRQTHEIHWPADALSRTIDKKITFAVDVILEPGRNQISVGVLDVKSEATGYARALVDG